MLNPSDVYVSGGYNTLYKCWTDKVSKFDASSFYNWEQDNLPILDLEERTHLLWERLGHPTSSLTGMSFIVSADAPAETCNPIYFRTLSSCVAALPDVINYPILIEVASFGDLGSFELDGIKFGPRGALEIVNRNFGKAEPTTNNYILNAEHSLPEGQSVYAYASAISLGSSALLDALNAVNVMPDIVQNSVGARLYSNNQLIVSSQSPIDSRYIAGNTSIFCRKPLIDHNTRLTASLYSQNLLDPFSTYATDRKAIFTPYENNPPTEDLISTFDASCINEILNSEILWRDFNNFVTSFLPSFSENSLRESIGIAYYNHLNSFKVSNCNGPIYIRNFLVDGGSWSGTNVGILVENSDVLLEQCAATRCKQAGLKAINSNVILTRGFIAYRNYGFDGSGNRIGTPWAQKIRSNSRQEVYGAGIYAENSTINFSSTYARDLILQDQSITNYTPALGSEIGETIPSYGWLYCLSKNDIGINSINSNIIGGRTEQDGNAVIDWYNANQIFIENNTEAGIRLQNSNLENSGRLLFYGNYYGLDALSSKILVDSIRCEYNQKASINLRNSYFRYNKDLYTLYSTNTVSFSNNVTRNNHQVSLLNNGTHVKSVNSILEITPTSSVDSIYGKFFTSGSFGVDQIDSAKKNVLPGIILDAGSKFEAVHFSYINPDSYHVTDKAVYGAAIAALNGSEIILKGSAASPTKIYGPTTFELQRKKAGLYANNGSTVKIQGPTVIARWAVDCLADNNSKLEITPHRNRDGTLDISSINLNSSANHTMVELHATRACLVADHGSVIEMEDLGDYYDKWNSGPYGSSVLLSGMDYLTDSSELNYRTFINNGSIQFYPNPDDITFYPGTASPASIASIYTPSSFEVNPEGKHYFLNENIGDAANVHEFSSVTMGGVCVKALNQSKVNVNNVHFPCGWWNPSAVIYDAVGEGADIYCNRLFIWNIADNSQLSAKYLSVSSLHPADAGYVGPSGTWGGASAAPISTPDTSSLSVLDYYGRGTTNPYGKSTAQNFGPFRLYFSIEPAANWLLTSSLDLSGYIPQVFSQGYNFSGNSVLPGTVSAAYTSMLRNNGGAIQPSGFYYASSMVFSPFTQKAILDDSAANTYANAKHNSVGKSGLAKLVTIYYPYTGVYGGDSADADTKSRGKGLRSVNNFDLEKDN